MSVAPLPAPAKKHFEVLDGLRGIAALAVVIFHFMEIVYMPEQNFIAHGFLAVDFFFCLSGFVIAYAYDGRMSSLGFGGFFKARLIRLHPLILFGSLLAVMMFYLDPFSPYIGNYSAGQMILIFLASALMIPYPVMEERFFNLFGLNAPTWSLFWEYIASIAYALFLYRLGIRGLIVWIVLAAANLIYTAYEAGNLLGGWAGENFWDGGSRVAYSFVAGMLIYRLKWIIPNKLGFAGIGLLLIPAFLVPYNENSWLSELFIVMIFFPLIVALGAGTNVRGSLESVCNFSGRISYPLYMTHYPFMWVFFNYYTQNKPAGLQLTLIIIAGIGFLILFAWLVMIKYDEPLRRFFARKRARAGADS